MEVPGHMSIHMSIHISIHMSIRMSIHMSEHVSKHTRKGAGLQSLMRDAAGQSMSTWRNDM